MQINEVELVGIVAIFILINILIKNIDLLTRRGRYYYSRRRYKDLEGRLEKIEYKLMIKEES